AIADISRAGPEVTDVESRRRHYARTLGYRSDALEARLPELRELAGERRLRIWRVYLAGSACGSAHGRVNISPTLAARPRRGPGCREIAVPMSRADIDAAGALRRPSRPEPPGPGRKGAGVRRNGRPVDAGVWGPSRAPRTAARRPAWHGRCAGPASP